MFAELNIDLFFYVLKDKKAGWHDGTNRGILQNCIATYF